MLSFIHAGFDLLLYLAAGQVIEVSLRDLVLLFLVNLIDLDHLRSRPVYKKGRDSFKTHFLHKNWQWLLVVAFASLFYRPTLFLGLGLMSHFALDYLDSRFTSRKAAKR